MKKNILKATFVAAFALAAGYGVYTAQTQTNLSDIALYNVEALAGSESGSSDCSTYCKSDSRYNCYITYPNDTEGITCYNHRKSLLTLFAI